MKISHNYIYWNDPEKIKCTRIYFISISTGTDDDCWIAFHCPISDGFGTEVRCGGVIIYQHAIPVHVIVLMSFSSVLPRLGQGSINLIVKLDTFENHPIYSKRIIIVKNGIFGGCLSKRNERKYLGLQYFHSLVYRSKFSNWKETIMWKFHCNGCENVKSLLYAVRNLASL